MASNAPATYTIRVTRGDDYDGLIVRWKDSNEDPIPITSARLHVRPEPDSDDLLLELDETDGLDLSVVGEVAVTITAAQTAVLRRAVWDLEATATAGQIKTLGRGKLVVDKDVTHA